MKKGILILLVFGVLGFAAWYFLIRKKTDAKGNVIDANGDPILPDVPNTATPPISGSGISGQSPMLDPATGVGLAAINKRKEDILGSNAWLPIQDKIRSEVNILTGVSASKQGYYNENIARSPITSAKNVPYNLSEASRSALLAFAGIDTNQGGATINSLIDANRELINRVGTCFIGGPELEGYDNFVRQVICQGYMDCGKKYKNMGNQTILKQGGQKAGDDMKKMANAWLYGAIQFDHDVTAKAIADLRAAGWRFTGYDF